MPFRSLDLLCPSCRLPFTTAEGAAPQCCDGAITRDDGLFNVIGARAHVLDATRDRRIAEKLVGHFMATFAGQGRVAAPGASLTAADADHHAQAAGLSGDEITALRDAIPFVQVSNNLKDYFSASRTSSPSTAFFGAGTKPAAGDALLDVGCSAGRYMLAVDAREATVVGLDLSMFALRAGARAWRDAGIVNAPTWVAGDLLSMPFGDAVFTHVQSSVVLAFVPIRAALKEIRRIMVDGGRLDFTIEGYGFITEEWDRLPGLHRGKLGLTRWWLARVLLENGIDWQGRPVVGRLSGVTTASPAFLHRLMAEAGFSVQEVVVLQEYRSRPRLIGVRARKLARKSG